MKSKYLIEIFKYWCGRLGLKNNFQITKDNRYDCHVAVVDYDTPTSRLIYNAKKLGRWNKALITCAVFHEIGHLLNRLPYVTDEEIIYSELRAEMFALTMLKQFYPKYYKINNEHSKKKLQSRLWCKKERLHAEAFKQIKEYLC